MQDAIAVLERVGNGELVALTVLLVAFVAIYSFRFAWWRTEMGRHVMAFMSVGAFVMVIRTLRLIWPDSAFLAVLRVAGLTALLPVTVWRIMLLMRKPTKNGESRS